MIFQQFYHKNNLKISFVTLQTSPPYYPKNHNKITATFLDAIGGTYNPGHLYTIFYLNK
jgi:hypothetical protein